MNFLSPAAPALRALLVCGLFVSAVHAGSVTWTLNNVTFSDGGSATGSFVTTGSPYPTSIDIHTTNGSIGTAQSYTGGFGSSVSFSSGTTRVYLDQSPYIGYGNMISFWIDGPWLATSAGTYNLAPDFGGFERRDYYTPDQQPIFFRSIVSGSLVGTESAVPEPGTAGLMAMSAAAVALLVRSRRRPTGAL